MAAEEFAGLDAIGERRDIWLRRFRRAAALFLEFERGRAGLVSAIALFGLAWLTDTFIAAWETEIVDTVGGWVTSYQAIFFLGVFLVAALTTSQSTATRTIVPIGLAAGLAPGLVAGTLAGSFLVAWVPTRPLAIMFTAIVYYASLQIMLDFKPKAHRQLPGTAGMVATGTLIGIFSSLVAAGGGFLSIPFMLFCNVGIRHAVGTSAALGFPIAVAGTMGFIGSGLNTSGLPAYSLGYVYLPALVGVVAISFLMAPVGAGFAHRLPVKQLKRAFGGFLALLATKMLHGLMAG